MNKLSKYGLTKFFFLRIALEVVRLLHLGSAHFWPSKDLKNGLIQDGVVFDVSEAPFNGFAQDKEISLGDKLQ